MHQVVWEEAGQDHGRQGSLAHPGSFPFCSLLPVPSVSFSQHKSPLPIHSISSRPSLPPHSPSARSNRTNLCLLSSLLPTTLACVHGSLSCSFLQNPLFLPCNSVDMSFWFLCFPNALPWSTWALIYLKNFQEMNAGQAKGTFGEWREQRLFLNLDLKSHWEGGRHRHWEVFYQQKGPASKFYVDFSLLFAALSFFCLLLIPEYFQLLSDAPCSVPCRRFPWLPLFLCSDCTGKVLPIPLFFTLDPPRLPGFLLYQPSLTQAPCPLTSLDN